MADVKDPKRDSAAGIQANLLAGKYKTPEDLAEAYQELEKKIGAMTGEHKVQLEQIQAQAQQAAAQAAQYQQMVAQAQQAFQQLQPLMPWLQTNDPQSIARALQYQAQAAQQQANGQVTDILTEAERQRYYSQWADQFRQQHLEPYANHIIQNVATPYIQQQMQAIQQQSAARERAITELLWDAIAQTAPPEKVESVRKRQQKMLEYSDPKNYDPRKFAENDLKREMEIMAREEKIKELEKRIADREAMAVPPSGVDSGVSPFRNERDKDAPKTREERIRRVVDEVREQDPSGMKAAFAKAGT